MPRFRFYLFCLVASLAIAGCQGPDTGALGNGSVPSAPAPSILNPQHARVPDRLYVGNAGESSGYTGSVSMYSPGGGSLVKTFSQNIQLPNSLAVSGDNLYVADTEKEVVSVFNVTSGKLTATLSQGLGNEMWLAVDSSNTLYVLNTIYYNESNIAVFNNGQFSHVITKGIDQPGKIGLDGLGNLYVPNGGNDSVSVYAKGATKPMSSIKLGVSYPEAVAFDSVNNVYVCNNESNKVTVYKSGTTSPFRTLTTTASPSVLAVSQDGFVYVASTATSQIDIFKPGATTASAIINDAYEPSSLVVDGRNNLYSLNAKGVSVYNATTGQLERLLTTSGAYPTAIVFGN